MADTRTQINIPVNTIKLDGDLVIPEHAHNIVVFAHGSGSSRLSPRNRHVASILNQEKFATLLVDLLTAEEDAIDAQTAEFRFDIDRLSERLVAITDWLGEQPSTKNLRQHYFGASTGGAAALQAAAQRPKQIASVVSRGGRPDLAGSALSKVQSPTLLIVGGNDPVVIELNQQAQQQLKATNTLEIIANATHLFEESGALDQVAALACKWFKQYSV